ncbi:MAG: hypothetical protein ACRETZ_11925, partial [Steroidobacteraceae bacterium]
MGALIAENHHQSRILIFGERVALLWREGHTDAAWRLGELWNELARHHVFRGKAPFMTAPSRPLSGSASPRPARTAPARAGYRSVARFS